MDGDAGGCTPRAVRIGPREQFRGLIFFEVLKMAIPSESLPRGKYMGRQVDGPPMRYRTGNGVSLMAARIVRETAPHPARAEWFSPPREKWCLALSQPRSALKAENGLSSIIEALARMMDTAVGWT